MHEQMPASLTHSLAPSVGVLQNILGYTYPGYIRIGEYHVNHTGQ